MCPDDDASLWSAARRGNRTAFATLFDRHAPALYRFAARQIGSGPDAEDVVQDVLLSVLERNGFDPARGSLRMYLFGAARNQIRKRARVPEWISREELEDSFVCPAPAPDRQAVQTQTSAAISAALQQLPWSQREVLLLFHYEELPLKEIATALELELAAVKSRLHRARESLRAQLMWLAPPLAPQRQGEKI